MMSSSTAFRPTKRPRRPRHEVTRLRQRTKLQPLDLRKLQKRLATAQVPHGVHHVKMRDGSFAVVKTVRGRQVVASFLTPAMKPPGRDVTAYLYKKR